MNIVVGRGNRRKIFVVPAHRGKKDTTNEIAIEQAGDDLKSFLFRPQLLIARAT